MNNIILEWPWGNLKCQSFINLLRWQFSFFPSGESHQNSIGDALFSVQMENSCIFSKFGSSGKNTEFSSFISKYLPLLHWQRWGGYCSPWPILPSGAGQGGSFHALRQQCLQQYIAVSLQFTTAQKGHSLMCYSLEETITSAEKNVYL